MTPRWIVALAAIGLATAAVWPIVRGARVADPARAPADEVLAYVLRQDKPLHLQIDDTVEAIVITAWAVLPRDVPCDPAARHPFGLVVRVRDQAGTPVGDRRFEVESRASCDPTIAPSDRDYAARLADGGLVSDPRTVSVLVRGVLPHGGMIDVAPSADSAREVIVRAEGRSARGPIEAAAFEQRITGDTRRRFVEGRASLGFVDLPAAARQSALASVDRRLEAAGREGIDYEVRRLLLRDYRVALPPAVGAEGGFAIGDKHAAALNLDRPARVRVSGPPGRVLRFAEPLATPPPVLAPGAPAPPPAPAWWPGIGASLRLDDDGRGLLDLRVVGPHTVAIGGEGPDFRVRFEVARAEARAQIGDVAAVPRGPDFAEIAPDVRVARFLVLDPVAPVVTHLGPGQEVVAIGVRAAVDPADRREGAIARVEARWGAGPRERALLEVPLPRTPFDRWKDGADATEGRTLLLRPPKGVTEIGLVGERAVRVQLRAPEPGVEDEQLEVPYQVSLPDGLVWRSAPYDVRRWAPVLADGQADLARAGRVADLAEQARIERQHAGGAIRPERVIAPLGTPIARRLFTTTTLGPGAAFPGDGWTPIEGARAVTVASTGPRSGRLTVLYRAPEEDLGKLVTLVVEGQPVVQRTVATLAGTVVHDLPPGRWQVRVDGLSKAASVYVDAAPVGGGAIVRSREVHELAPGSPLVFAFPQGGDETLHVNLLVADDARGRDVALRYRVDRGAPPRREGQFFRVLTEAADAVTGRVGDAGQGMLWESDGAGFTAGLARMRVHLGDDLVPGTRTLEVALPAGARPVWVGAVLYGQGEPAKPAEVRLWSEQEER